MPRAPYNCLILPWRRRGDALEVAVFWTRQPRMCQFLAGGGEDGETPFDAAVRETFEEAAIEADEADWIQLDAVASVPRSAFPKAPWPEHVHVIPEYCFAVHAAGQQIRLSREHQRYEWLGYAEAWAALTWDSNRVALYELNRRITLR